MTYLFIHPFRYFDLNSIKNVENVSSKYFLLLSGLIISLSFNSLLTNFARTAIAIVTPDINYFRQNLDSFSSSQGSFSISNLMFGYSHELFFIAITLYFIGQKFNFNSTVRKLLFTSSFSIVIYYLSQGGRTGLILWGLFFSINYLIFSKLNNHISIVKIKKLAVVIFLITFSIFMLISSNRFSASNKFSIGYGNSTKLTTPVLGILDYFGQSIVNFDIFFNQNFVDYSYGSTIFPLFDRTLSYIGLKNNHLESFYQTRRLFAPEHWFNFSTFLRNLWYDFGPIGSIIIGIIFNLYLIKLSRSLIHVVRIKTMLILFLLFSISFMGVFGLFYSTMPGNFVIAFIFLLPKKASNVIIKLNA